MNRHPTRLRLGSLFVLGLFGLAARAEEPKWVPMLGTLPKTEKSGFGGLCGVAVDRQNGNVLVNISDRGFYLSTDGAKSFKRISDTQPKGRTETPGCFLFDPTGKSRTVLTALVYGSPVSTSEDGATWKAMSDQTQHVDWAAVDWTDPERKFVLALKHEAGELLLASHDGGKSFAEVGKGYGPAWIFDAKTAVAAVAKTKDRPKLGLARTEDGGKTWQACADFTPVGGGGGSARTLPKWRDGTLFWLVEGALISTGDAGKTWKTVSSVKNGRYGPVFGEKRDHFFVLTAEGVLETVDGGANWSKPIPVPPELKGGGLTWLDFDPKGNHLYLMRMGSDLYKMTRSEREGK